MNNMIKQLGLTAALMGIALAGFAANWVNFSNFMEITSLTTRNGNEVWVSGKGAWCFIIQQQVIKHSLQKEWTNCLLFRRACCRKPS